MGLLAYDSFTGAYNTIITAHTPEAGGAYTIHPVTSGQVARIAWDMVFGATAIVVPGSQPTGSDYSIEVDHLCQFEATAPLLYVRMNATAPLNAYYFEWKGAGVCSIKRHIDGVYSGMSATYTQASVLGQKVRLRLSVATEGSDVRLKAYVNGVEIISWLDNSASKITTPGLAAFKIAGANTLYGLDDNLVLRETDTSSSLQLFEGSVKHVYQRDSAETNVTNMTFRGAYNGSPSSVEVQILNAADGATVVKDWTALSSLTLSNGYFTGTLSVPNGAWYIAKARFANETSTVSTQANKWGVGICILTFGQSNMANMFSYTAGTQTPDDKLVRTDYSYGFVQNANWQGACPMGNEIVAATGLPVCLIDAAISGSSLENLTNGAGYWLNLAGTPYTRVVGIRGLMPKIEAGFFAQGEQEARTTDKTVATADYITNMDTLFGRIRALFSDATLPIFVTPLIVNEEPAPSDVVPEKWNYIRWGHIQVIDRDDECYFGANGWDISMAGGVHYSNYGVIGYRTGLAYTRHLGLRSFGRGPKVLGYVPVNSTTFDLKIQHDGGTDISPSSGITGFRVYDDTTLRTITSAMRQDAETVRLIVDAAVTTPKIYHVFGCIAETQKTAPIVDNTTAALPLWPSDGAITLYDAGEVDTTQPVLTGAAGTTTGQTTATLHVTTDTAEGVADVVVTTSATKPSAAQTQAGTDHTGTAAPYHGQQAVAASGVLTFSATGLTASTTYYAHFTHEDLAGNDAVVVSSAAFTTDAIPHVNTPPTGTVSISGTPTQGQTLSVVDTLADVDGLGPRTYTWKFDGVGTFTGSNYLLTASEVGKSVSIVATYTDGYGAVESVTSSPVGPVAALPHVNTPPTGSVSISGTTTQGQTLTASNTLSDVDGIGTITYTWRANGTIVGTGTTYALQAGDVGDTVTVTASYTDGYGAEESVTSNPVGPVISNSVQPPVEADYGSIVRITSIYTSPEEGGNTYTGDIVRLFYDIKHKDLTPYDLSGLTLRFALARSVSGPAIITKTIGPDLVVVDAANGEIKVVLRPEDSVKLVGQFYTEIKAFSGTNPTTIHTGKLTFSKTLIKKG